MIFAWLVNLNAKHVVIIVAVIHVFLDLIDKPQIASFASRPALLVLHYLHALHV